MFGSQKMAKTIDEQKEKIRQLTVENQKLRKENQNLRVENHALRAEISQIMAQIDKRIEEAVEKAVAPLKLEIAMKDEKIKRLESEVERLQGIINKDSTNSSIPPSQNKPNKKIPNSREPSGKKPGGQPGHEGHRLGLPKNMDELIEAGIAEKEVVDYTGGSDEYVSRWEIDIKIKTVYREYRYPIGEPLPIEHQNEVSYGKELKAITALLWIEGIIAQERLTDMITGITHGMIQMSDGTVDRIRSEVSKKIGGELNVIERDLVDDPLMNVDDTVLKSTQRPVYDANGDAIGVEESKKTTFSVCMRTHSNNQTTLYTVNPQKNKAGVERDNILPNYTGILSHDHEKKFYSYGREHATCCEHLCRELKGLNDVHKNPWAMEMRGFMYEMNRRKNEDLSEGKTACDEDKLASYIAGYEALLTEGSDDLANQSKDTPGYATFGALLKRLYVHKTNYLLFLTNYEAPFSNNLSLFLQINYSEHFRKYSNGLNVTRNAQNNLRLLNQAV